MKTKKIWANLAVGDVEKTHEFYKALGFKPNGEFSKENEIASFLVGEDNFVIHFFSKESENFNFALGGDIADTRNGNEVMFTLSADGKQEVDEWAEVVKNAGGTLFAGPAELWGKGWYGCGFADLDGHKFNVFYNGK